VGPDVFEALRRYAIAENIPLPLVAPVHGDALRLLLDPEQAIVIRAEHAVPWLDNLEPFLNQEVTVQTLREWRSDRRGWIIVATHGGMSLDPRIAWSAERKRFAVIRLASSFPMTGRISSFCGRVGQ